jgi:hypothetical protein
LEAADGLSNGTSRILIGPYAPDNANGTGVEQCLGACILCCGVYRFDHELNRLLGGFKVSEALFQVADTNQDRGVLGHASLQKQ